MLVQGLEENSSERDKLGADAATGPGEEGAFAVARLCGGQFQRDTSGQKALGVFARMCFKLRGLGVGHWKV